MNLREVLLKEIEDLERDLKSRKKMLRELDTNERLNEASDARFTGVRPIVAIRRVLREHNGSMPQDKLTEILIAGGITAGKKRSHHNVRIAIEVSEKVGSLIVKDGIVSLPANDPNADE